MTFGNENRGRWCKCPKKLEHFHKRPNMKFLGNGSEGTQFLSAYWLPKLWWALSTELQFSYYPLWYISRAAKGKSRDPMMSVGRGLNILSSNVPIVMSLFKWDIGGFICECPVACNHLGDGGLLILKRLKYDAPAEIIWKTYKMFERSFRLEVRVSPAHAWFKQDSRPFCESLLSEVRRMPLSSSWRDQNWLTCDRIFFILLIFAPFKLRFFTACFAFSFFENEPLRKSEMPYSHARFSWSQKINYIEECLYYSFIRCPRLHFITVVAWQFNNRIWLCILLKFVG